MVGIVTAFQFIAPNKLDFTYNPYTYKNQYLRSSNFSGENLTTDCINADDGTFYVDCANHRVGIGTTTPDAKLKVTIPAGSAEILSEENYGLILRGNDYISRMWIDGANSATIDLDRGSASKTCAHQFRTAGAIDWIFGIADSDVVGLDGTEFFIGQTSGGIGADMIIKTDGKIGIGTISPSQTLSVVGTLNVTSWTYTAGLYTCDNGTHTIMTRNKTLANDKGCSI